MPARHEEDWIMSGSNKIRPGSAGERSETVGYIQALLGQLRTMAEKEKCDMLAYLIEMAYIEAGDVLHNEKPSRPGIQKRNSAA